MEILQTLLTALTTPNEGLIKIVFIFYAFIEMTVIMLFFTTVLNISSTKNQKVLYVILTSLVTILTTFFAPVSVEPIITLLSYLLLIKLIFKPTLLRSIIALIVPLITIAALETILIRIYTGIFNVDYNLIRIVPIYRLSIVLLMYFTFYLLYRLFKHYNITISLLDNMNKSLIIASICGLVAIIIQIYLVNFYNDTVPVLITLLGTICAVIYFFISMYSLTRTTKLEITEQNLTEAQLYNASLKVLYDHLRSFKHDFSNILQAIGGYASTSDIKGLQTYYAQLLEDCQTVNNLSALSPDVINNPAVYSILASKYLKGDELGIKINLDIFLDLNALNTKIYQFTRILGILLDNAIEASIECNEKIINVEIRKDTKNNRQVLIVENTYTNKDINIDKIFEKNYTSKKNHSGIGLWEVNQILNKNTNLALYTTKNDVYFRQQFEIYEN